MVAQWWNAHDWPEIPPEFLPTTGMIVPDVAAGFLYFTDSKVAMIEWIVSNPKAKNRDVYEAIVDIIRGLKSKARAEGYEAIFSYTKAKGLLKVFQKSEFKITDREMTHVIWRD